ncbi:MAG: hypothetical protein P4L53_17145 [Candidatus Obscuribacterales bacterium]|nr:hypothetical protein [Candidatus Obscuribacterales bacterium]
MGLIANLFKFQPSEQEKNSQKILDHLKQYRGKETARWLNEQDEQSAINFVMNHGGVLPPPAPLKVEDVDKYEVDDSPTYQPPIEALYSLNPAADNSPRQLPSANNAQVDWIERMFDQFAQCARNFNSTHTVQNLSVSVHRPEYSQEKSMYETYLPETKATLFKGHISTSAWGLLVQGHADTIEIFIIPADRLLTFTINDIHGRGFIPFMVINSEYVNNQLEWHIENEIISLAKLPILAKELFCDLIRVTSGQMQESELFASYSGEMKLGETVAMGYAPPPEQAIVEPNLAPVVDVDSATWSACRDLVQLIDKELATLAEKEHVANDSGQQIELNQLKSMSGDLRSLSGSLSELLNKYAPTAHAGAS